MVSVVLLLETELVPPPLLVDETEVDAVLDTLTLLVPPLVLFTVTLLVLSTVSV